jgi:hypothetical protein
MWIFIKKFIHSKRNSGNLLWKYSFLLRDFNYKYFFKKHIEKIKYKIKERKWRNHTNITKKYRNQLFNGFGPVLKTKSIKCYPKSSVELHVVSGHFHLTMFLLAIKSLLRFYNRMAVVVHDGDNTLTHKDIGILKKHIPGIIVISKHDADKKMKKILSYYPKTWEYRSRAVNSLELLDNLTLSRTKKVITMNSDVLFLKKPKEVIDWIKAKNPPITYVYENVPAKQKEFLHEMDSGFPPHFTCALACFYKDIIDYSVIESALSKSKFTKTHPWLMGQCIYPLLLDKSRDKYKIKVFNKKDFESSGIFKNEPVFRHYWSSLGDYLNIHIHDSKRVMEELL